MVIRQQQQLALHREHLARLRPTWAALERGPRVVVHIPSLSLPCSVRSRMDELDLLQFQPGRLCDVHDPDVSVILVSPMPLSTEITEVLLLIGFFGGMVRSSFWALGLQLTTSMFFFFFHPPTPVLRKASRTTSCRPLDYCGPRELAGV